MSSPLGADPPDASGGAAAREVAVGRVGRPHGLDGSFYVTRPRSKLLSLGARLTVGGRFAVVVRRAGTDGHPIVRLEGVEDRAGAEALRGAELTVTRGEVPTLAEGEWWAHELEGCTVTDGELVLGTVTRLLELPSCEVLEVRRPRDAGPLLIPMVKDAIRRVAPQERRIDVDGDFLDLGDAPASRP